MNSIDFSKIDMIYGMDIIKDIRNNIDVVNNNIKYMNNLGFRDTVDIFEKYAPIFLDDTKIFKKKINALTKKMGVNYVEEIESNLDCLEELL